MSGEATPRRAPLLARTLGGVAIAIGVIVLARTMRPLVDVVLVIFAGVLLSVFLDGVSEFVSSKTRLPRRAALALVVLALFALFAAFIWLAGPRIARQMVQLSERIPEAAARAREALSGYDWSERLLGGAPLAEPVLSNVVGGVIDFLRGTARLIIDALIVLFIGIYLAVAPQRYVGGALRLLPQERRGRGAEVFSALGLALRRWLAGRIASMVVVGALTFLGLWLLGIPLAFTLGLFAALMAFVPYVGPVLSAVPAILVALAESPVLALWVIGVYIVVQILETYIITPLIQERAVRVPPALLITVQVFAAVILGPRGIFLATPIAVVAIVLIQMLYIEDRLGDAVTPLGGRRALSSGAAGDEEGGAGC